MKNIENKEFKFKQSLLSDTFLKSIKSESLKLELQKFIFDGFINRLNLGMNQKEYAKFKNISLSTLKRIELGKCYDLKLISKYCLK